MTSFTKYFLVLVIFILSNICFADRTFHCDLPERDNSSPSRRLVIQSQGNFFPRDYKFISIHELNNGEVVEKSNIYDLELLEGNAKVAVFRFFIGNTDDITPVLRYGILAWDPGAGKLFITMTTHGLNDAPRFLSYAGADPCRNAE